MNITLNISIGKFERCMKYLKWRNLNGSSNLYDNARDSFYKYPLIYTAFCEFCKNSELADTVHLLSLYEKQFARHLILDFFEQEMLNR